MSKIGAPDPQNKTKFCLCKWQNKRSDPDEIMNTVAMFSKAGKSVFIVN